MYLGGYFPGANHSDVLHATQTIFRGRYGIGPFAQEKLLELADFDLDVEKLAHEFHRNQGAHSPESAADFLWEKIHNLQRAIQRELRLNHLVS